MATQKTQEQQGQQQESQPTVETANQEKVVECANVILRMASHLHQHPLKSTWAGGTKRINVVKLATWIPTEVGPVAFLPMLVNVGGYSRTVISRAIGKIIVDGSARVKLPVDASRLDEVVDDLVASRLTQGNTAVKYGDITIADLRAREEGKKQPIAIPDWAKALFADDTD